MKKVIYSLQIGIVGSINSGKEIFLEYLKKNAINGSVLNPDDGDDNYKEYLIMFKKIPIKMKTYLAENLNKLIFNYEKIKNLDILLLVLNVHNMNSLNSYNLELIEEFNEYYFFKGILVLAGIQKDYSSQFRLSEIQLINKAKEVNALYCYEIKDRDLDLSELFDKVLNDYIFKFKYNNPDLYEDAKKYGLILKDSSKK